MKIYLACSTSNGFESLIGVYSSNDRAIMAVSNELGISAAPAADYVYEAELDHQLGDN